MNLLQLEKCTLPTGVAAYRRVLENLRALNVLDFWDVNSRSSLSSLNYLRERLGLPKVEMVDEEVLAEIEMKLGEMK